MVPALYGTRCQPARKTGTPALSILLASLRCSRWRRHEPGKGATPGLGQRGLGQPLGHMNRTTSMVYDVAGRVTSSTDPKAQSSSFQFNAVGQPTVANLPGETVTYGYGGNGRTESVTDNRGQTLIAYEAGNDRVSNVTDPVTGQVGYTYRLTGERA